MKNTPIKRITLEMSLKPFLQVDKESIHRVCQKALSQWEKLIERSAEVSVLLWVAEGSEILTWKGDLSQQLEWARYVGYMNDKYNRPDRVNNPVCGRPYIENPANITYGILKDIILALKEIGRDQFGRQLQVGATFDIGPEFARSEFKYKLHPEINQAILNGQEVSMTSGADCVCYWSKLDADQEPYAGYPAGIPQGTLIGEFLGRQANSFMQELGYDYIWFSNGFGFSCLPWTYLGVNFDGHRFDLSEPTELKDNLIEFWTTFRDECPYPVEVRGTNFSTGIDLASDLVPLNELYREKFFRFPPPNSPWGALDNDFGLEMIGYMSRIAELPGEDFPFRYYINDPWYWQNPWWDYYNREPFDIYCPMSVSRLTKTGLVQNPSVIELITIDTEKGHLNENCALEVTPHISKAVADYPDAPGILTWLYPFDEYSNLAADNYGAVNQAFLGDWFIRNAINTGFPLNTVCSTRAFQNIGKQSRELFNESILCAPTLVMDDDLGDEISHYISNGGNVLFYGPAIADSILNLLNLKISDGLSGEFLLETDIPVDDSLSDADQHRFLHDPVISGGELNEVLVDHDPYTSIKVVARQNDISRIFALTRSRPDWNGGIVAWVRGSLPFDTQSASNSPVSLPKRQDGTYADTSILMKYILADFGYRFHQTKPTSSSRETINFVSRKDNAFIFSGFKHDTTTGLKFGFPDGAPVITGRETLLNSGMASYSLDKSFHLECRVFVKQQSPGPISCREVAPRVTALQHPQRRVRITGLDKAEVTIYPPLAELRAGKVEVNNSASLPGSMYREEDYMDLRDKVFGPTIKLTEVSGPLEISW